MPHHCNCQLYLFAEILKPAAFTVDPYNRWFSCTTTNDPPYLYDNPFSDNTCRPGCFGNSKGVITKGTAKWATITTIYYISCSSPCLPFSYIFIIETFAWYNIKYTWLETTELHLWSHLRMSEQKTQDFLTTKEIIRTIFNAVNPMLQDTQNNTRKPKL